MIKWDQALESESPDPASGLSSCLCSQFPSFTLTFLFPLSSRGFFEVVLHVSGWCLILL